MSLENITVDATDIKIAFVVAEFYQDLADELYQGAIDTFLEVNGTKENTVKYSVPGVFEIPFVVSKLVEQNKYDAIITLGLVVRGETLHFDYICSSVSNQLASLSVQQKVPIIFGILTTEDKKQAWERVGGKKGHKGIYSMKAALHMISLRKQLDNNAVS